MLRERLLFMRWWWCVQNCVLCDKGDVCKTAGYAVTVMCAKLWVMRWRWCVQNCGLCDDGDVCTTTGYTMTVMCSKLWIMRWRWCVHNYGLCDDGDVCKTVCYLMTTMCAKLWVMRQRGCAQNCEYWDEDVVCNTVGYATKGMLFWETKCILTKYSGVCHIDILLILQISPLKIESHILLIHIFFRISVIVSNFEFFSAHLNSILWVI